ncbi:MAG: signal peptidase I [Bacilli bacterium]|nr:signal peptidase I [Bacilli bacterium]
MKKALILYTLLILYIVVNSILIVPSKVPLYNELINPLMWIIICGVALFLSRDNSLRIKDENNKTQSLVIIMIIYIILYFLLGLVFGFQKTPYSKDILSILSNLWSFGGIIFFQEFIRASMVKIEKRKALNFVIIVILFTLANLSFGNLSDHFVNIKESFIYTVTTLIPLVVTNGVLTYLAYIGGAKLPIIYRLFVVLPEFIVPILPNLDWFVTAVIGITLPLAVFVYLNYIHVKKIERYSRRERKKYSPVVYIPVFAFIAIVAAFVIGLFKYQPVAVLSGSMSPTFDRGDAVVIRKLTDAEKNELKKDDVIQFTSGSKFVVHRIVDIDNDQYGNRIFVTKGDHNNGVDVDKVGYDQIVGKVSFVVKYIGYPSVWLSGMVS